MKKNWNTHFALFLLITLIFNTKTSACGFDFVGGCPTTARFSINGVQNEYFVSPCDYGLAYPRSFGTNITTFQLTGGSTRTWESCTNNVLQSTLFYRIYKDSTNKGAFLKADLTLQNTLNAPPYRTKTYSNNLSIDLLSGLLPNTAYTLEIYHQVGVDSDENGTIDQFKANDNAGVYYKATFTTGNITISSFPITVSTKSPTCSNSNNGTAKVTTQGGRPPFAYAWSVAGATDSVSNLGAGNYSVTVTDASGAKSTNTFTINAPAAITPSLQVLNAACGASNGSITTTVTGGVVPYTYVWSIGVNTPSVSNLPLGNYSLTVVDSKGCRGSASAVVIENCTPAGSYCSSASQGSWIEWIGRVQFSNLDNESSKTRPDKYAVGYSDWKDKIANISKGQSYPLTITPGLSYPTYQSNLYYRVWIDFNKNGIFDDSEKVLEKNALSAAVSNTVVIPQSALSGSTIMRISAKKDAYPTACENFVAGEVEDYTIIIASGAISCSNDTIKPVFITNCPANIIVVTASTSAQATWIAPTATDNCTATPSVSSNFNSGQNFPIGTTNVTYTARDSANNSVTCSFTVTVRNATNPCDTDRIAPVFTVCPSNIAVLTATTSANVTWTSPVATDNCSVTPSVLGNFSSGSSFPLGTTPIVFTATDAKNNIGTCRFNVTVSQQTGGGVICKKYTAQNTNEVCSQTWKPYGMVLIVNNQRQLLQAQAVVFENRGDTVAIIRGTFRTATWAAIEANVTLSGGTTVAPTGSPRNSTCASTSSGTIYFTAMSGTLNINNQNLTIARRGAAFQLGNGANLQNNGELGAAGDFTLSDNTQGEFGFKLVNQTTCTEADPLFAIEKPILDLELKAVVDKAVLTWVNNTSDNNDYFVVEKADENGIFKAVETINELHSDRLLHTYTYSDIKNTEGGDNYYRIKSIGKDGAIAVSEIKKVSIANINDVVIFPNPVTDNLQLSLKSSKGKDVKILIYSSLGVLEKTFNFDTISNNLIALDIANLAKGQHFIRIITQNGKETMKMFVKSE